MSSNSFGPPYNWAKGGPPTCNWRHEGCALIIIMLRRWRLSKVRSLPQSNNQPKASTLGGALVFHKNSDWLPEAGLFDKIEKKDAIKKNTVLKGKQPPGPTTSLLPIFQGMCNSFRRQKSCHSSRSCKFFLKIGPHEFDYHPYPCSHWPSPTDSWHTLSKFG